LHILWLWNTVFIFIYKTAFLVRDRGRRNELNTNEKTFMTHLKRFIIVVGLISCIKLNLFCMDFCVFSICFNFRWDKIWSINCFIYLWFMSLMKYVSINQRKILNLWFILFFISQIFLLKFILILFLIEFCNFPFIRLMFLLNTIHFGLITKNYIINVMEI
jgi:hypothetical protein